MPVFREQAFGRCVGGGEGEMLIKLLLTFGLTWWILLAIIGFMPKNGVNEWLDNLIYLSWIASGVGVVVTLYLMIWVKN
jgi:hypothetical protein